MRGFSTPGNQKTARPLFMLDKILPDQQSVKCLMATTGNPGGEIL